MSELFSELKLNNIVFKNRIVMPPMATEKANKDGSINDDIVDYYKEMAKCSMGLLIVEHCAVTLDGRTNLKQISIARDSDIDGHKKIANAIHNSGVLAAIQINHAGSNKSENFPSVTLSSSSVPHPKTGIIPDEMNTSQIVEIVKSFGKAAKRAKLAGYDIVEIHSAHGFLCNQFLSPLTNKRNDLYGCNIENRMRFLLEVVEEVIGIVGADFPVFVRLGISDNPLGVKVYENGLTLEEGLKTAKKLESMKISVLDISGGFCGSRPPEVQNSEGYFIPFAEVAKEVLNLPILITGGIKSQEFAEKILKRGIADLIGIGRALVFDKNWVLKAKKKNS